MKSTYTLTAIALTMLSLPAFSNHVVTEKVTTVEITGAPVVLSGEGPYGWEGTAGGDYRYISLEGTNKVCFPETDTRTFGTLKPSTITFKDGTWNCYVEDPAYFKMAR